MKNFVFILFSLFLFLPDVFSQELARIVNFDYTTIKKVAVENGYIYAGGYVEIPASRKLRDGFVVKLAPDGQIVWQNSFGGMLFDQINDFIVQGDRIYAVGITWTKDNQSQVWFAVLSSDGQVLAQSKYGNALKDGAYRIIPSDDGNFFILGYITPQGIDARNLWIVKIDRSGNILWEKQYGALNDNEEAIDALPLGDGMLVIGRTWHQGVSDLDPWMIMLSYSGEIIWQTKNHLYEDNYFVKALRNDNSIWLIGETWEKIRTKKGDIWLVNIDLTGKTISDKVIGRSVVEKINDGLIINDTIWVFGGYSGQQNASIWQVSTNGTMLSQKVFDLPVINSVDTITENELVIGGGMGKQGYIAIIRR